MGSVGNSYDKMNVPFDEWGDMISIESHQTPDGNHYYIEDEWRHETEPAHEKISKTSALKEVSYWQNDDGTYGTGDEAIYIAYDDGRVLELTDGEPHRRWSKKDISGVYFSGSDDQYVWGGEWVRRPGQQKMEFAPFTTTEWDDDSNPIEGYQNAHSYYREKATWKVRVKITYPYNEKTGRYDTKREIIRQSTKKYY